MAPSHSPTGPSSLEGCSLSSSGDQQVSLPAASNPCGRKQMLVPGIVQAHAATHTTHRTRRCCCQRLPLTTCDSWSSFYTEAHLIFPIFFKWLTASQRGDMTWPRSPCWLRGKAWQQSVSIGFGKGLHYMYQVLFQEKTCVRKCVFQFPLLLGETGIWSWIRAARSKVNPHFLPLRMRQSQRYTNHNPTACS